MRLLKRYRIEHESELIYAKRDIGNFLKRKQFIQKDIFTFALMELGSNLIKHAQGGEIWLLKNESYMLAAVDRGPGIEDINWAKQKGNSTYPGSLGLGLSQLSQHNEYKLDIFSQKELGTTVLFHREKEREVYFTLPLIQEFNGDLFVKKGRYYLFADIAGHGIRAFKMSEFIKDFFFKTSFSCIFIDDFLKALDSAIKAQKGRGVVLSIVEATKKYIYVCGVGNIEFFIDEHRYNFKDGIIGVAFSSSKKYRFERPANFYMKSDGVDVDFQVFKEIANPFLAAIVAIYYSNTHDDRSILIIKDR